MKVYAEGLQIVVVKDPNGPSYINFSDVVYLEYADLIHIGIFDNETKHTYLDVYTNITDENGVPLGATYQEVINALNDLLNIEDDRNLGSFENYDALILAHPTADVGVLAYVINSQGTNWLPGSWGGNFYSKGNYVWNGTIWDSAVDDIAKELEDINTTLETVVTDDSVSTLTNKTITDFSNDIHANLVHIEIQALENLLFGDLIVADGTSDVVIKAKKQTSLTEIVIGVVGKDVLTGNISGAVAIGVLKSIPNTGSFAVNDILYPNGLGGFTKTPTILNGNYNQPLALVVKSNTTFITIEINVHSPHEFAKLISYNNAVSGLVATNVQTAIDEVKLLVNPAPLAENESIFLARSGHSGFDREAVSVDPNNKNLGIMQYCHNAASGIIHEIGSDSDGTYTELTAQTHFADGTALADRTLMQYHDAGETQFSYWYKGTYKEVTDAKFIVLANDFEGYIYYGSDGELSTSPISARALIVRETLISYIYNNPITNEVIWFCDERHGIVISGQSHLLAHLTIGFFIGKGGMQMTGVVDNGVTFDAVVAGYGGDEDVKATFSEVTTMSKLYKENGYWRISDNDNKLGIFRDLKCCYNDVSVIGSEVLSEINSDYLIMMPTATNNKLHPHVSIVGQKLHLNRGAARDNLAGEFYRIQSDGLPSHEYHPLSCMIIHNEVSGQIEKGENGEIYINWRFDFPLGVF